VPDEALIANVSGCLAGSNKMQVVAESPVKYTYASIKSSELRYVGGGGDGGRGGDGAVGKLVGGRVVGDVDGELVGMAVGGGSGGGGGACRQTTDP
jgi:hypothetical protein